MMIKISHCTIPNIALIPKPNPALNAAKGRLYQAKHCLENPSDNLESVRNAAQMAIQAGNDSMPHLSETGQKLCQRNIEELNGRMHSLNKAIDKHRASQQKKTLFGKIVQVVVDIFKKVLEFFKDNQTIIESILRSINHIMDAIKENETSNLNTGSNASILPTHQLHPVLV